MSRGFLPRFLTWTGLALTLTYPLTPHATNNIDDYCFKITPQVTIGMEKTSATPESFMKGKPKIKASINGTYYGQDLKPQGMTYIAENHHLATERPEDIRGYFSVDKTGRSINVGERLPGKISDYYFIIGTHPLLVANQTVDKQANEPRCRGRLAYRSALGTKIDDVCFAVSEDQITINEWAKRLQAAGYRGAINLDGGPVSQLAVRNTNGIVEVKGKGNAQTKLVIFSYEK